MCKPPDRNQTGLHNKTILIFFISMVLLPACLGATTYYVSKDGSDSNLGTIDNPWMTFCKATATLLPGDTVYIKKGVYNEVVVPKTSGTPGNFITYSAYENDEVILDGQNKLPMNTEHWEAMFFINNKSYISIKGLRAINSNGAGFMAEDCSDIVFRENSSFKTFSSGIGIWGCKNVILEGNSVQRACQGKSGPVQECLSVSNTVNFEIKNNKVFDRPIGTLGSGGEGMCIKEACRNGRVFNNTIYDLILLGLYIDGWESRMENLEVYGNTVYNARDGIVIAAETKKGSLKNIKVYNNIVYDNRFHGISISDNNSEAPCGGDGPKEDIFIAYNTVFHNGFNKEPWGGGISIVSKNNYNQKFVITNNICSQNAYWQILISEVSKGITTISNNLIDGTNEYKDESDQAVDGENAVIGGSHFQNPEGHDFRLTRKSSAIDAGTPELAPNVDFFGKPRPVDGNADGKSLPDLGALEADDN
ncbi:right-handed parallel beta-helix repeat-containing protein [bacterium]|nr:right-handed parallel beta-helix repeat-containing protein [bacterium]